MPSDFTVIQAVRQRFGDASADLGEVQAELEAPFVGSSKDFAFSCPNVVQGEFGVLQFETFGVSAGHQGRPRNILRINGVDIPGGITPGPTIAVSDKALPVWKSHSLLVPPNALRKQNVLHVEATSIPRGPSQELDNFIIDNIVVFFKTASRGVVSTGQTL
jgi:hypothetical protein